MKGKTIFSFALLLVMSLWLSACRLEAPKAGNGQSGGNTTSRPGDAPTAGDPGGAGKVLSTPDEVKEEIEKAVSFFSRGGIGVSSQITTFHNMLYTLIVLKKAAEPNSSSQSGWTTDSITEEFLRDSLQKDVLLRNFVQNLSNEEELLREMMTKMHELAAEVDPEGARHQADWEELVRQGKAFGSNKFEDHRPSRAQNDSGRLFKLFALYLSESQVSYDMDQCSPEMKTKVAAVSDHRRGAKICFNLKLLESVQKYQLHQELHGYLLHEFLHLMGYKESEVQKIHNLYLIMQGFSADVSHVLTVQRLLHSLRGLARATLGYAGSERIKNLKIEPGQTTDLFEISQVPSSAKTEVLQLLPYLFVHSKHPQVQFVRASELREDLKILNFYQDSIDFDAFFHCEEIDQQCDIQAVKNALMYLSAELMELHQRVRKLVLPLQIEQLITTERPLYANMAGEIDLPFDREELTDALGKEHRLDGFDISHREMGSLPFLGWDQREVPTVRFDFSFFRFESKRHQHPAWKISPEMAEDLSKRLKKTIKPSSTPPEAVTYESVFLGSYRDIYPTCVVDTRLDF